MTRILFLPGAGGSPDFWKPVGALLPTEWSKEYFGWPGLGNQPHDPAIGGMDDLVRLVAARIDEPVDLVAQSMGGVIAARLALERPERVARLVLVATSGGIDVARLGAAEWRDDYRTALPDVPTWFVDDRTDLTGSLAGIRAPTLLLWSDADPISPPAVAHDLAARIPGARLIMVAGGSHAFASERPDEVASILRSHLA